MKKNLLLAMLALFSLALSTSAQTLTLTAGAAEITSSGVKDHLYSSNDLYFIYNHSTGGFEARIVETRAKVYGANISTVSITGLTTAVQKIAWIENTHLKCNTAYAGVLYSTLVPKNGISVRYNVSGKSTSIFGRFTREQTALWYGHADSIKTANADNTTDLRLAALRKIVRGATPQLIGTDAAAATIVVGAAAGSGGAAAITGNGLSGEIDIDTGSSTTTTGVLATVTLPVACPNGCRVVITPSTSFSATMVARVFATTTAGTFVLNAAGTAVTASTADLKFFYTVTCY